jgi:pectate lyase
MKKRFQPKFTSVAFMILSGLILLSYSCKKGANIVPSKIVPVTTSIAKDTTFQFNLSYLKSDSGNSYKIAYRLDWAGDSNEHPEQSTLRLFEDGVELGPAHTGHQEIRDLGRGRFSHWGNSLYFSSSDNTNPVLNRRKYTCTIAISK